jgi:arabinose-5-phosphate isomerase
LKSYFDGTIAQLRLSFDGLPEDRFEKLLTDCEGVIRTGGKIVASGLGKNEPICEKFVGTMVSFGMEAFFLNTNSAMHGDLGAVADRDLILVLSKSGNTAESIRLVKYISSWRTRQWLLSFNDGGELGRLMEHTLLLPLEDEGDLWNIAPSNSAAIYLILLQGLAMNLARRLGVEKRVFLRNHPGGNIGKIGGRE